MGIENFVEVMSHIKDMKDVAEVLVNMLVGLRHVCDDAVDPYLYRKLRWGLCEDRK